MSWPGRSWKKLACVRREGHEAFAFCGTFWDQTRDCALTAVVAKQENGEEEHGDLDGGGGMIVCRGALRWEGSPTKARVHPSRPNSFYCFSKK
jgi:hypothetical protein